MENYILKNYYLILNVNQNATEDEIYLMYKEKIAQFNGLPFHTSQMIKIIKELKEAIYVLGNTNKRKKYNLKLSKGSKYNINTTYNENTKIFDRTFSSVNHRF